MFRLAQVAQFKQVAVVEVGNALGQGFHQDARGARIADIQHQIHIHRGVAVRIDDLSRQIVERKAHHVKPCEVGGQMLQHVGVAIIPSAAPTVLRLLPRVIEATEPFIHPGRVEKPRIVTHKVGQHKVPVGRHILRRKRMILLALSGTVFHIGVKHEHNAELAGVPL